MRVAGHQSALAAPRIKKAGNSNEKDNRECLSLALMSSAAMANDRAGNAVGWSCAEGALMRLCGSPRRNKRTGRRDVVAVRPIRS